MKGLGILKHAVSLAPAVNSVWNSLGVVACQVQPDQINMTVNFVKCTLLYLRILDKSLFTRHQKHTAMYNRSPCCWKLVLRAMSPLFSIFFNKLASSIYTLLCFHLPSLTRQGSSLSLHKVVVDF